MTSLTCPHCEQGDSLRMVSAVYFAHQTALAHHQPISEQDIELAQQLAPPEQNNLHQWVKWGVALGSLISLALTFLLSEYLRTISLGISIFCVLSYVLIFNFWYVSEGKYLSLRVWSEEDQTFSKKKRIWGRLYYCSRDHLVFDTRTPIRGHPKDLNRLIDQIIKSS